MPAIEPEPAPTEPATDPTTDPTTPQKEYAIRLTRDDRIRIQTLREAGLTYQQISQQLHINYRQVQYACQASQVTPKKPRGATPKLSDDQIDEIITWISQSKKNRRMPYYKVIKALDLSVSPTTLAYALKKRGYTRCKALRKPDLGPENRRQRLIWALEHVNWTIEQWNKILWTDETWVTSECHTRIYVTRTTG